MSRKERIDTSSPAGKEEVEAHTSSEEQGTQVPPAKRNPVKRNPPVHTIESPPYENPKKTGQKPRD